MQDFRIGLHNSVKGFQLVLIVILYCIFKQKFTDYLQLIQVIMEHRNLMRNCLRLPPAAGTSACKMSVTI